MFDKFTILNLTGLAGKTQNIINSGVDLLSVYVGKMSYSGIVQFSPIYSCMSRESMDGSAIYDKNWICNLQVAGKT